MEYLVILLCLHFFVEQNVGRHLFDLLKLDFLNFYFGLHFWLVNCKDFTQNKGEFRARLLDFLEKVECEKIGTLIRCKIPLLLV